jgi:hypothetical protein
MYLIWGARSGVADDPDLTEHDVPFRRMTISLRFEVSWPLLQTAQNCHHLYTYIYICVRSCSLKPAFCVFPYQLDIHSAPYVSVSKPASYTDFVFSKRIFSKAKPMTKTRFYIPLCICLHVCAGTCELLTAGSLLSEGSDGVTDCGSCGIFVPRK